MRSGVQATAGVEAEESGMSPARTPTPMRWPTVGGVRIQAFLSERTVEVPRGEKPVIYMSAAALCALIKAKVVTYLPFPEGG